MYVICISDINPLCQLLTEADNPPYPCNFVSFFFFKSMKEVWPSNRA